MTQNQLHIKNDWGRSQITLEMIKETRVKIQLHVFKRGMYKECNTMEEIAQDSCDNYMKPRRCVSDSDTGASPALNCHLS